MTKAEFARRIGKSSAAVSQFESGKNDPSIPTIKLMAQACGITFPEFWGRPPRAKPKKKRAS